jgi:biotin-dependent carboxylase-like uncharacterized protein
MTKSILKVLDPGASTCVQDSGRIGFREFGVPPSGWLDRFAPRVANILVGNPDNAATLEMTFIGGHYRVVEEVDVAVTGADMPFCVNNRSVPTWSKFRVYAGDQINIGMARSGCRAYLAVTGGIAVAPVMNSCATFVGARIGGYEGRILKRGDIIAARQAEPLDERRSLSPDWIPRYMTPMTLRVIPGPQQEYFSDSMELFFSATFAVSSQADRKGYRLQGPRIPIQPGMEKSIISEPCLPGCIQVPEDGQPIILLGEQTVGGYAKIATVITADLDRVAQAMPGDKIRFQAVDIETARTAVRQRHHRLELIRQKMVTSLPFPRCAEAMLNMDPEVFCRKVQGYLNQVWWSECDSQPPWQ